MRHWLPNAWMDLRFAARTFARQPGFALVAILTLALGIGASTAVFSIVEAVLLRPLPYHDASRLTAIWLTSTREEGLAKIFATYADYREFRRRSRTLSAVSAATWATRTGRVLTGRGRAREILTIPASASFFTTLGVSAFIGRTFHEEDETHGCSLVLAHKFWTDALSSDPAIAGQTLTLDRQSCTVLGVMPESFSFYPPQTQAWILIGPNFQPHQDRMLVGIFGRLQPGATLAQAQTELRSLYRGTHRDRETRDFLPVAYDLHSEFTFLAGRKLRTTLILVFAAVLLVLLIACLNIANLLLGRLSQRRRELAVRSALGSGQSRLIRQVLTEGLLLSGLGTIVGIGVAYATVRYFRAASPIELTAGATVSVNLPVLVFSGMLSIITTLAFALIPALRASRVDLTRDLKTAGRGSVPGSQRMAKFVIGLEMALSFMLLIGASLLTASALRMGSEPLGFDPHRMLSTRISLPADRYGQESQRTAAYRQLLERLEPLPGVAGVALASRIPPDAGGSQVLEIESRPEAASAQLHEVGADAISPAFLDVLDIPLRRGRRFEARDQEHSQPVTLINDALAGKYFPGTSAIGQRIRIAGGSMPWLTVVGVVGNLKHTELMNEMSWVETPILYRPLAQDPRSSIQVAVRASGNPGSLSRVIQREIAAVDPSIPVNEVAPVTSHLTKALAYPRFRATVLTFFALGALLLSAVGLHGVLSQLVAQRIPEFGLRRVVGAQTGDLLWLVARQAGLPVVAGVGAGLGITSSGSHILSGLLYGVQPSDPPALMVVSLTLLGVAGLAILAPARRAARVDPMVALRDD